MTDEKVHRHLIAASVFPTGNPWLDDAWAGGIDMEKFLLVAAKTGVGKTFFGVQLASFAARNMKNVYYFALEAEKHEIERRRLYYALCKILYENYPQIKVPRYAEWIHMHIDSHFSFFEEQALESLKDESTLTVKYNTGIYTPEMFSADVVDLLSNEEKPDLIILDHLHHFFLMGDEIDALKTTIHQIKRLKSDLEIPIVVLAQLRKNDAGGTKERSLPKFEDIRGTAALTDVATDVLIISPVPADKISQLPDGIDMPMYFHLAKSRTASEAKAFAGIVGFDIKTGAYNKQYAIGKIDLFKDPKIVYRDDGPFWAKNAKYPIKPFNGGFDNE